MRPDLWRYLDAREGGEAELAAALEHCLELAAVVGGPPDVRAALGLVALAQASANDA